MREFDELLDQLLREDAREVPRPGMERRVLERVYAESRGPSRRWMMWGALAATALSAGVMVWINARPVPGSQRMSSPTVQSQGAQTRVAVVSDIGAPNLQSRAGSSGTKRRVSLKGVKSPSTLLREDPIRIEPIEIAPLVIDPIDVASQRWNVGERKVKPNEDVSWNVVLLCDSRCIDRRNGTVGEGRF
jgi:hypothetical protein